MSKLFNKSTFETRRTKRFRMAKLSRIEKRVIGGIETYGCEVIHVKGTSSCPEWCYTVGVYDTCGKPEVIVMGLPRETAHPFLNEAARRLRNGVDLTQDRNDGMLEKFDCEFCPLDPKWVKHLMGWAVWYYLGSKFPVLQAVCTYSEPRFPGYEVGNPSAFPDTQRRLSGWKFFDSPDKLVFSSEAVCSGLEPVTRVSHDASDGAWQFLGDSMVGEREPVGSCFYHLIEADPTLNELADLPPGWWAERTKPGSRWKRHKHRSGYDD